MKQHTHSATCENDL